MNSNTAHNKILKFAPIQVSMSEFRRMLKEDATPSNPINVSWRKEDGSITRHDMYWIEGPLGNGIEGGTNTKRREGMVNIPVVNTDGVWRTLTWDGITRFRFNNKTYTIK